MGAFRFSPPHGIPTALCGQGDGKAPAPLVGTGASVVVLVLLCCQSGRCLAHGVGGVISICAAWLPNIGLTTFTTVP